MAAVHGLQLAPDDTEIIVDRPAPHSPIRSINARQVAGLLHQYNTADVDDSVLFPFLHGLEGSNVAQNMFFSQARRRMDRPKLPRYRGLVLVRVDEQGLELDARGNVRYPIAMDDQLMHKVPHGEEEYTDDDDTDSELGKLSDQEGMSIDLHNEGTHMHPVAERHPQPPPLVTDHAFKSSASHSESSSSSSDSPSSVDNFFASPTNSTFSIAQTTPPTTPHSNADGFPKTSFGSFSVDPKLSALHSNFPPADIVSIPDAERRPSHVLVSSMHPDELLTWSPPGPVFVNPKIPDGISLRNFGIQAPIYATLSDIVVYSPKGRTRAALELAEKFKHAVEAKAIERGLVRAGSPSSGESATMCPEGIVYNVYICTDSFEVFEQKHRHLVAIDGQGKFVQKVDLMEREKEEMKNLTKASEIAERVYLGNTGDVPIPAEPPNMGPSPPVAPAQRRTKSITDTSYDFDAPNTDNIDAYDICIECHDMASFPTFVQLRAVEERIRGIEEAWKLKVRQREDQEADEAAQRRAQEIRRQQETDAMDVDAPNTVNPPTSTSSPDSGSDADVEGSSVKVLDGGLGLALDMPPLQPSAFASALPTLHSKGTPLSSNEPTPMPSPPITTAAQQEPFSLPSRATASHPYRGHGRSRSLTGPKPLGGPLPVRHQHHPNKARLAAPALPPRPAPPASHVIHLSFPSSPPATPGTLTSMIPFLHFLQSLAEPKQTSVLTDDAPSSPPPRVGSTGSLGFARARSPSTSSAGVTPNGRLNGSSGSAGAAPRTRSQSLLVAGGIGMPMRSGIGINGKSAVATHQLPQVQLSRPLRILMHAGDGYTETSVLALSYLMLVGNKSLPEAYLDLQVQRKRSFFVYSPDVGVLRRVEQRLKMDREREREKMAASIAATAASVTASAGRRGGAPSSYRPPRPSSAASNSSSSSSSSARGSPATPTSTTTSPPPSPSSGSKWKWGGLPTSWKSGSLSGAGVSFLNGSGMFSSLGSSSANPVAPTPVASAGLPSIGSEESRRALFTPPMEEVCPLDRAFDSPTPPLTPCLTSPSTPVLESPSDMEDPAPLPAATSQGHRFGASQRPSSLSQSYVSGQAPVVSQNPVRRARASTSPLLPSFIDHESWFNDPKFEGSFPSRVLPFLYLGNLAHAANAYMLHALGITHVVSVGECALIPPPNHNHQTAVTVSQNHSGAYQVTTNGTASGFIPGRAGSGSLWVEEKEGRIKVLDIKGVCDDGIDSLRPQIAPTVDWIDRARAEGGKILIHCRVGVSRSATVTIAYVMHHLKCSLVDAYLMVRSRRLSVLIQPNMRLLYNLCGWEIELARRRAEAENREVAMGEGRQLNWPHLAREVHILNERYLS